MSPVRVRRGRSGFTLTDLVITVAILAVLVAFMLPAVRQAREPARRTQCKNNLKQFGLALHNYYDSFSCFPAGYSIPSDGRYTGWGWEVPLLPLLDQNSTYEKLDFSSGLNGEQNHLRLSSPMTHCPADPSSSEGGPFAIITSDVQNGEVVPATVQSARPLGRSTYFGVVGYLPAALGGIERTSSGDLEDNPGRLGNRGSAFAPESRYCDQHNFRGVFGQNSAITFRDIKDGSSNVLMVGERYSPQNSKLGTLGHGTWLGVPDCSTSVGLAAALGDMSVKINLGAKQREGTTGFSSAHKGGAQFLFADGSARFLSEDLSITTYRDLSTIDDGREVGEF